jgi:anti-sigma factor RsiW
LKAAPTDYETIKGYLLGQIPAADEPELEARLLTDREFYEEVSIVEDELIDRYLRGDLSASEKEGFESHFVSSAERKRKVRFARAFRKYISVTEVSADEESVPVPSEIPAYVSSTGSSVVRVFPFGRSALTYAMAASILIVIGVISLFFAGYMQRQYGGGRVLAVELIPAPATRGGNEVKQITLTPDVGSVRLQLDLPENDYQSYEATLRDSSTRSVLKVRDLKPQNVNSFAAVTLDINADLLSPGDYRIQLSGTTADGGSESVATYSFTIHTQ